MRFAINKEKGIKIMTQPLLFNGCVGTSTL